LCARTLQAGTPQRIGDLLRARLSQGLTPGPGHLIGGACQGEHVTVLLVDAANVVGSRPDGWWRDRVGATTRLLTRLAGITGQPLCGPDGAPLVCRAVVAVVEGRARGAEAPDGVGIVCAEGSGDDALVTEAARLTADGGALLVVTADRGLRGRLPARASVAGPAWLLGVLDRA
jgi:hypothetical protein